MIRKLCTLLAVLVFGLCVFGAFGCERAQAARDPAVSSTKAVPAVALDNDVRSIETVQAVYVTDRSVILVRPPVLKASMPRYAVTRQVLAREADNYDHVFASVRQKPKLSRFNGVAYVHYARADV